MKARAILLVTLLAASSAPAAESLSFSRGTQGEFTFNTGVLRGVLRAGGVSKGLSDVVHIPTGQRLDSSMGLLSHYRVFTLGKRYGGGAWDWPGEAALEADGSVVTRWAATAERPFALTAQYRWISAEAVEVTTTVTASQPLKKFESFLASYFTPSFTNSLVCTGGNEMFTSACREAGDWQAFPRDAAAAAVIRDGRWTLEPHPVDWKILPVFQDPIALRGAPGLGLTVALMADPRECFGILTPFEAEGHFSTYFSQFGKDLQPGEKAGCRVRLQVFAKPTRKQIMDAYAMFQE